MNISSLVFLKVVTSYSLYHELFGEYGVSRPDYHKLNYHQVQFDDLFSAMPYINMPFQSQKVNDDPHNLKYSVYTKRSE